LPARSPEPDDGRKVALDWLLPVGLTVLAALVIFGVPELNLDLSGIDQRFNLHPGRAVDILTYAPLFVLCYVFADRPIRFGLSLAALTAVILFNQEHGNPFRTRGTDETQVLYRERSFFGVVKVRKEVDDGRRVHSLVHGTTLHGKQIMTPDKRREAITYYHKTGPIGQLFEALCELPPRERFAVVGLGTGSLVCYAQPGEDWTYYEIDPLIERIARDPEYFTYLQDCPTRVQVVLGDARLKLKEAPDGDYGLIIVDAFSSDAIPIHLLTREALELYFQKLRPDGVLVMHISNRYLNLEPVLARLAEDLKLEGMIRIDQGDDALLKTPSHWVVLGRKPEHFGKLNDHENWPEEQRWRPLRSEGKGPLWTDDFSNLIGVFNW
jgi:spermidine synthase